MTTTQRAQTITRQTNRLAVDAPDLDAETPCGEYVRTHGDDPWYPTDYAHSEFKDKREAAYANARSVCQECPLRLACLDAAMNIEGRREAISRWGMWGGLDPIERHLLARRLGKKGEGRRRKPIDHGTTGGYQAHHVRGEEACDLCREAQAADRRKRRA